MFEGQDVAPGRTEVQQVRPKGLRVIMGGDRRGGAAPIRKASHYQPGHISDSSLPVRNDDLHPCAQSRREGREESRGHVVKGVDGACYIESI